MCRGVATASIDNGPMTGDDGTPVVPAGFEDFYRHEWRALLRLAWSLTGRRDLGEELVQEVMVRVHDRWDRISSYERPGAFARRLVLNDAISSSRRHDAEKRAVERLESARVPTPDPPPDPAFWDALRALPERQCHVVALHYVEDRSIDAIAELLDIAPNTVKVHLHRGRNALAEQLAPREEDR